MGVAWVKFIGMLDIVLIVTFISHGAPYHFESRERSILKAVCM